MRTFRRLIVLLLLILAPSVIPRPSAAQVSVSITVAPPPLPVYVQPAFPGPGWIWAPGYWAWGPYGYYWVPGTWVRPPRVGFLWTPGWWGWANGFYVWHAGYWGPHVGFYGGINYGFGYIGAGYFGGYWAHGVFHYNAAVNNFGGVHVTNVYRQTTVNNINITRNVNITRVSYNGGQSGVAARPTPQEESYAHEQHVRWTKAQMQHETMARTNPSLRSSFNHGHPLIAATPRPAAFHVHGVVRAQGARPYHPQPGVRRAGGPPDPHRREPKNEHPKAEHPHDEPGRPARPGGGSFESHP